MWIFLGKTVEILHNQQIAVGVIVLQRLTLELGRVIVAVAHLLSPGVQQFNYRRCRCDVVLVVLLVALPALIRRQRRTGEKKKKINARF